MNRLQKVTGIGMRKSVDEKKQFTTDKLREEVRVEVKRTTEEEWRKKRIVIFGLKESEDSNMNESVEGILSALSIAGKPVSVRKFTNKEKKEGGNAPVMVEFCSERERMHGVGKENFTQRRRIQSVFLEMDLSREAREERKKTQVLRALKRRKADDKQKKNQSEKTLVVIEGDPQHVV